MDEIKRKQGKRVGENKRKGLNWKQRSKNEEWNKIKLNEDEW